MANTKVGNSPAYQLNNDPLIIGSRPIDAPNGTNVFFGGTIVRDQGFGDSLNIYGLVETNGVDGDLKALTVEKQMIVPKTSGVSGKAITNGDPLTFKINPASGANDWFVETAVSKDVIHAYAMADALTADTTVRIFGPLLPWNWTVKI